MRVVSKAIVRIRMNHDDFDKAATKTPLLRTILLVEINELFPNGAVFSCVKRVGPKSATASLCPSHLQFPSPWFLYCTIIAVSRYVRLDWCDDI